MPPKSTKEKKEVNVQTFSCVLLIIEIAWNFFCDIFMYPQIYYVRYLNEGFYIKVSDWWDGFYF